jgi:hypothetical protein
MQVRAAAFACTKRLPAELVTVICLGYLDRVF